MALKYTLEELEDLTKSGLEELARENDISGRSSMDKEGLILALAAVEAAEDEAVEDAETSEEEVEVEAEAPEEPVVEEAVAPPEPEPEPAPAPVAHDHSDEVTEAVEYVRMAIASGYKTATVANACPEFSEAVLAALEPVERLRVSFGGSNGSCVR